MSINDVLQDLARRRELHEQRTGWTDMQIAFLGNGGNPPVVVVPPSAYPIAPGAMYCLSALNESRGPFQVINSARSGVPSLNTIAGAAVWVGYPPGSNLPYIEGPVDGLIQGQTGGATLADVATEELRMVTLDRIQELKLSPAGGLTVIITDGIWRSGDTIVRGPQGVPIDLTSYVPSTSGKSVWVLISVDSSQNVTVTNGVEFDLDAAADQFGWFPITVLGNDLALGYVLLTNGDTQIENSSIIPIQSIPGVYSAEIIDSILIDASGNILVDASGNVLTR